MMKDFLIGMLLGSGTPAEQEAKALEELGLTFPKEEIAKGGLDIKIFGKKETVAAILDEIKAIFEKYRESDEVPFMAAEGGSIPSTATELYVTSYAHAIKQELRENGVAAILGGRDPGHDCGDPACDAHVRPEASGVTGEAPVGTPGAVDSQDDTAGASSARPDPSRFDFGIAKPSAESVTVTEGDVGRLEDVLTPST